MSVDQFPHLKAKLKEIFGYHSFRDGQEKIIRNVLNKKDIFVIMPTGSGKSLCYQFPSLLMEGTAIIISPLIALMKNQVDQLQAFNIDARVLNSTLSKKEINIVRKDTLAGKVKLIYVAPESLIKEDNVSFLKNTKISFVAVDEAHCISEWGHDFRPEYRRIRFILDQLGGNMPLLSLTATATLKVQQDIVKNLCIENAVTFKSSFNRENLYYEVRPKINAKKQLIKYVKEHKSKSGIVYCLSRKKTEEISELLSVNGIKACSYHAGMEAKERIKNQDAFLNEDIDVIVATIAFGMGIDKPDVRFIVHYDAPKSLEGYYQETGRAGRDGGEGNCLMFYSYNDILKLEKYNKDKPVTEKENAKYLIDEMVAFAESAVCRRKQLLHYFGEVYENNCGLCDNCRHPKEKIEGKQYATLVLKAVVQTQERFKMDHIINVLAGKESQYVKSYNHNKIEVFAKGKDKNLEFWGSILRQLIIRGYLRKDIDNFGVIKITKEGIKFIENPQSITFTKDHDYSGIDKQDEEIGRVPLVSKAYDQTLFEMLKGLRKKIAKEKGVPPYIVFQDPSLEEMSTTYPVNEDELAQITGVGRGKVTKFGNAFIKLIARYVKDNDIITASDVVVKSTAKKSKDKIFIIQQIDKKVNLDEIIKSKSMTMAELTEDIEQICFSGTKLNLDYYIDQILDQEKQDEIYNYFMDSKTDDIHTAIVELDDETLTEEDLRLMRIKFISEMGN